MNKNDFKELWVWQVNEYIKMLFDSDLFLSNISVRGEISNFKYYPSSGHMYFSLKDEQAVMKAVMFKSNAAALGFMPENGMKVVAIGRVSAYPRDGVYQLYVSSMKKDGAGALYEALENLKKKLSSKGMFDEEHKKALPAYPRTVGIVTSLKAAALRDMLNVIKRRNPSVKVVIYPAAVQGNGAWRELTAGIEYFGATGRADVVIIGRGGGAYEDLWEFNNEILAKAIYDCPVPVISAVGHETDFTICDFVADKRAPTPSAAAEIAVPDANEIKQRLNKWEKEGKGRLLEQVEYKKSLIEGYSRQGLAKWDGWLKNQRILLDNEKYKLENKQRTVLERKNMELMSSAASLEALNPLSVLGRGFAYVSRIENGENVRSAKELQVGDRLNVRLHEGSLVAIVEDLNHD